MISPWGILAVTAAPKFLNLQSDARKAAAQGVQAALQSGSKLVYSKAALDGLEASSAGTDTVSVAGGTVKVKYGYPTNDTISAAVTLDGWVVSGSTTTQATFVPENAGSSTCNVTYKQVDTAGSEPEVDLTDGCD